MDSVDLKGRLFGDLGQISSMAQTQDNSTQGLEASVLFERAVSNPHVYDTQVHISPEVLGGVYVTFACNRMNLQYHVLQRHNSPKLVAKCLSHIKQPTHELAFWEVVCLQQLINKAIAVYCPSVEF